MTRKRASTLAVVNGDVKVIYPRVEADKALESGNPGPLLKLIAEKIHQRIQKYYMEAQEKKAHAGRAVPHPDPAAGEPHGH